MASIRQENYYKLYGTRRLQQLRSPRPINVTSLPRNSFFHHHGEAGVGLDTDLAIFNGYKRTGIFVDGPIAYEEPISGMPIRKERNIKADLKRFVSKHDGFSYKPGFVFKMTNPMMLSIYDYSYLDMKYKYPSSPLSPLDRFKNTYTTLFTNMKDILEKRKGANHYFYLDLPDEVPSFSMLKMGKVRKGRALLNFAKNERTLLFMELYKWLDAELHEESVFSILPESELINVNMIIRKGMINTIINLAYLKSFIDGQENLTPLSSVQQVKHEVLQKLLIAMAVNLTQSANELDPIETLGTDEDAESVDIDEGEDDEELDDEEEGDEEIEEETSEETDEPPIKKRKRKKRKSTRPDEVLSKIRDGIKIERNEDDSLGVDVEDIDGDIDDLDKFIEDLEDDIISHDKATVTKDNTETDEEGMVLGEEKPLEVLEVESLQPKTVEEIMQEKVETLEKSGVLKGTQLKRAKTLSEAFKTTLDPYTNKPIEETLGYADEDLAVEESETELNAPRQVLDRNMSRNTTRAIERKYHKEVMRKDIINTLNAIQRTGVAIEKYDVEVENSVLGQVEVHSLTLHPLDGKPSTVKVRLPVVDDEGVFTAGGNRYIMRKQNLDVPIRKIAPTVVSLSTAYGKTMVETARTVASNRTAGLVKKIYQLFDEKILSSLSPGDVYDNYFKAPRIYQTLSSKFRAFTKGKIQFLFDRSVITEKMDPKLLAKLEKDGSRVCGSVKGNGLLLVNPKNEFFRVNDKDIEELGTIETILEIDPKTLPLEYAEIRIFTKRIPVALVLSYLIGFKNLLGLIRAIYVFHEGKKTVRTEADEFSLRTADGVYVFKLQDSVGIRLLAGLGTFKTFKNYTSSQLNTRDPYLEIFAEKGLSSIYLKEIEMSDALFIDPISEGILKQMGEPLTYRGLLLRAVSLLDRFDYPLSQDRDFMYIRGYEKVSAIIYKEMVRAIKSYHFTNFSGRAKVNISPYKVWTTLMDDKGVKIIEDINPLQNMKESDIVTYIGEGGRDKGSMNKMSRRYTPKDFGIISEANIDSGDVGVTMYLTADPNIETVRGLAKKDKDINAVSTLSMGAQLSPFTTHDDSKRVTMSNIMNSHIVAAEGYEAPIVRTGAEYMVAKRVGRLFAFSAKDDGKVISVDDKGIIVEYKDGSRDGCSLGRIFGNAEGTTYPHYVVTELKQGARFSKNDVLAYNTNFFERDLLDPKQVVYKGSLYAKTVLVPENSVFEDSSAITANLAKKLVAKTTKTKRVLVKFDQAVSNMVKVGTVVKPNDVLVILEDEITANLGFDKEALNILSDLGREANSPTSKYNGVVERIEVVYNGELSQMHPSLAKIAKAADAERRERAISSNGIVVESGKTTEEYRSGKTKLTEGLMEILFYITVENSMGVRDKGIFANQLKTTIGETIDYELTTEAGEPIDAKFMFKSILARIVYSPQLMGTTTTLMKLISKETAKIYKGK